MKRIETPPVWYARQSRTRPYNERKVNNVALAEKFFFYTVDAFETQHLSNTR